MIDRAAQSSSGAPLVALSLLATFWVFGRIVWETYYPSSHSTMSDRSLSAKPLVGRYRSAQPRPFDSRNANPKSASSAYLEPFDDNQISAGKSFILNWASAITGHSTDKNNVLVNQAGHEQFRLDSADIGFARSADEVDLNRETPSKRSGKAGTKTVSAQLPNRLSGYFWLFLRQGNGEPSASQSLPFAQGSSPQFLGGQYGASQAGAILSYRVFDDTNRSISLFARGSAALSTSGQEELAVGVKAKPVPELPVSLYVEQRFRNGVKQNLGTAVYVAGGTGPDSVIGNTQLETYGQAGYVFGRSDSYFFDASVTLQQPLMETGSKRISIGGGVWTGGQRGIRRVDIGPRAAVKFPAGQFDTQVSLDWRNRIAGNAAPGSGLALTLTSGF